MPVAVSYAGNQFYAPTSATVTLLAEYMTGRALVVSGTVQTSGAGLKGIVGPTPDTGAVSTAGAGTVAPPCVATFSGIATGTALCASVKTSLAPGQPLSTASLGTLALNAGTPTAPIIVTGLTVTSSSTCSGASGTTTFGSLSVNGVVRNLTTAAPNTTIALPGPPGSRLVLNEQKAVAGSDPGMTATALHLIIPSTTGVSTDFVAGSATSGVHNCP